MLLDRRGFVAAGSAAMLSACATIPKGAGCSALPLVRIDPSLVKGAYGCLRPYRASGFVVRSELLGGRKLVHNYGHGGAGITLSWGSSKLATALALQGHHGPVAVIGAGVMGLTTARLIQQAGFPVTIYAAEVPPNTTSNLAGGQWGPTGHYRESAVTSEWRAQYRAALAESWRAFQALDTDRYGISWLPTYTEADRVGPPGLEPYYPDSRLLTPAEHPFSERELAVYRTMYVEVGRYLSALTEDVLEGGGTIRLKRFANPAELLELSEQVIINCTGLGSHALFGDEELGPARGQIVVLQPQPEINYAVTAGGGYMFPRPDGIILGGTFEHGQWAPVAEPATVARILERHRRFFSGFRCTA